MSARDTVIASLTDAIVSGDLRRDYLAEILGDRRLFDQDDELTMMRGPIEARLNVIARVERYATDLVAAWLESDPRGEDLIQERIEQEREDEEELRELDERSAA